MLDVHPPHEAAHSWKDFFIHVGTICVGLLIAVSLEQSVEYLHRQHERHLLEHELHAEAEILQRNAEIDITQYNSQLKYLLALRKDISLRIATNGSANPPVRLYVAPPMGRGVQGAGTIDILNPIWESARTDGRLALLPEGIKRAYGVVAHRKAQWDQRSEQATLAMETLRSLMTQCSDIHIARTPDFSCMSQPQLIELRVVAASAFEKMRPLRLVTVQLSGELNLVLGEGFIDQQSLTPADGKFLAEAYAAHPEDYARMADEIDAEDNARDKAIARSTKTN